MTDKYILGGDDGRTPTPVDDIEEWVRWFKSNDRRVAEDHVGPYRVSTVFLGLDHNFAGLFGGGDPTPIVFETMVFAAAGRHDVHDCDTERCSTWDEAVAQHERIVTRLKQELSG